MQIIKGIENALRELAIPQEFGGDIDTDDYYKVDCFCNDLKEKIEIPFKYAHGVSKLAIIFDSSNWVIKIPFTGMFNSLWGESFEHFKYANKRYDYDWDYCNAEVEKYQDLVEIGLECFLAETRYLCSTVYNFPIYIQEKVIPANEDKTPRTPSKKAVDIASNGYGFAGKMGLTWIATAIDFYGEEKTKSFLEYIETKDTDINNDLHTGNFGYREDGSPCILDYSGWNEY